MIEEIEEAKEANEVEQSEDRTAHIMSAVALPEKSNTAPEAPPMVSTRFWRASRQALVREVRTHPFGYSVLAVFVLAGPLLTPMLFPQASPAVAMAGGLAFGVYAALCAVPQKFL